MYLAHYGLTQKPFSISPDPDFLWLGEKHAEALAGLEYGILENKGFLLLTGEIGSGKTVLINGLLKLINEEVVVANIQDPRLELIDFYNMLAHKLKLDRSFEKKVDFLIHFGDFLIDIYRQNKKVLLIIDEAQRLEKELLDEIRVLSNIELDNRKLMNIFFVGQSELKKMLLEERNRPLKQRITYNYHLDPLIEQETAAFIEHRLKVAGAVRKFFTDKAFCEIHNFSQGIPRLINIICDHSLMTGYSAGSTMIDAKVIKECAKELQIFPDALDLSPKQTQVIEFDSFSKKQQQNMKSIDKPEPKIKDAKLKVAGIRVIIILIFGIAISFFYIPRIEQSPNLSETNNDIFMAEDSSENPQKQSLEIVKSGVHAEDTLPEIIQSDKKNEETNSLEEQPDNEIEKNQPDNTSINKLADVNWPRKQFSDPKMLIANDDKKTIVQGINQAAKPAIVQKFLMTSEQKFLVHFKYDSADLDSQAFEKLKKIAQFLSQNSNSEIIIEGYADSYGDYNYNKTLSQFRSNIVESYLISQGISKSKITSIGFGSENPLGNNRTPEGRNKNRRVEIRVINWKNGNMMD
jgi:general secretion pathway protein A